MKFSRRRLVEVALGFSAVLILGAQDSPARLVVRVTGVRNARGKIHVGLWRSKQGFPKDVSKAWRSLVTGITNGNATAAFADVPYGEYAIAAFHDENSNGKMDSKFLGIPAEGIGASNNPHPRFGPPSFEDCRFEVAQREKVLEIKLIYL